MLLNRFCIIRKNASETIAPTPGLVRLTGKHRRDVIPLDPLRRVGLIAYPSFSCAKQFKRPSQTYIVSYLRIG